MAGGTQKSCRLGPQGTGIYRNSAGNSLFYPISGSAGVGRSHAVPDMPAPIRVRKQRLHFPVTQSDQERGSAVAPKRLVARGSEYRCGAQGRRAGSNVGGDLERPAPLRGDKLQASNRCSRKPGACLPARRRQFMPSRARAKITGQVRADPAAQSVKPAGPARLELGLSSRPVQKHDQVARTASATERPRSSSIGQVDAGGNTGLFRSKPGRRARRLDQAGPARTGSAGQVQSKATSGSRPGAPQPLQRSGSGHRLCFSPVKKVGTKLAR
jgi:hypothetical protein